MYIWRDFEVLVSALVGPDDTPPPSDVVCSLDLTGEDGIVQEDTIAFVQTLLQLDAIHSQEISTSYRYLFEAFFLMGYELAKKKPERRLRK